MTWLLFLIFLGYYAYQQYYLGVPAPLEQANIQTTLLMLSLTVIGPFFVSYALTRAAWNERPRSGGHVGHHLRDNALGCRRLGCLEVFRRCRRDARSD